MSRSGTRRHSTARHPAQDPKRKAGRRLNRFRGAWPLVIGMAVVLAGTVIWLLLRPTPKTPPTIDLSRVDTSTSETIQKHLAEVKAHPGSGPAWGWLGGLLRVYEFPSQAQECLLEAERLDPLNPRWPHFLSLLLAARSPIEAIEKARRAAQLCGNNPETPRFHLARLLAEQGDWPDARRELEQLVSAKPAFTPALLLLAHEAQNRGDLAGAITLAARCTNDVRTTRSAWALLAVLYQRTQQAEPAAQAAARASQLPAAPSLQDPFEGELAWRRGDPRNTSMVCHELLAAGQIDQATPLIERLRRDHPGQAETWLLVGRLQILRKDFAAAEQSLRHHLQFDPDNAQGLFQLGSALLSQKRFADAAQTFARATQLKPDFGPAYFNQGFALANAGNVREAIPAFRQSIKHNPEHIDTYFLLADLHLRLGQTREALDTLDQAALLNPADPRLRPFRERAQAMPNTPAPTPNN